MSDVTRILSAIDQGDPQAAEQLLPLVYQELRHLAAQKLAQEKPGQTLQATALVHEAYLRLVASGDASAPRVQEWNSRGHFFAAAAEAMRRILIDQARKKKSRKHGGGLERHPIEEVEIASPVPAVDLLAVHEALEKFEQVDQLAAEALAISGTTADRHWAYARAWLHAELKKGDGGPTVQSPSTD